MKFILISGMSGAGKSTVLHSLEDCDYYCIDNLPIGFLDDLTKKYISTPNQYSSYPQHDIAISLDISRSKSKQFDLDRIISTLKQNNVDVHTLFINADNSTLLRRYNETRRPHPMSIYEKNKTLEQYISEERTLLDDFAMYAEDCIDTSNMVPNELYRQIREQLCKKEFLATLTIQSFGYKKGLPANSDYVFDARYLKNPYWNLNLRTLNGLNSEVAKFLKQDKNSHKLITSICSFLSENLPNFDTTNRNYVTISIGCSGGCHRSVYIVEKVYDYLHDQPDIQGWSIKKTHRDLL